jgi:hypothetical protein
MTISNALGFFSRKGAHGQGTGFNWPKPDFRVVSALRGD